MFIKIDLEKYTNEKIKMLINADNIIYVGSNSCLFFICLIDDTQKSFYFKNDYKNIDFVSLFFKCLVNDVSCIFNDKFIEDNL